jgi:hypothetical protein
METRSFDRNRVSVGGLAIYDGTERHGSNLLSRRSVYRRRSKGQMMISDFSRGAFGIALLRQS